MVLISLPYKEIKEDTYYDIAHSCCGPGWPTWLEPLGHFGSTSAGCGPFGRLWLALCNDVIMMSWLYTSDMIEKCVYN